MLPTKPPILRQAGYLFARLDHLAGEGVTFQDVCNPDYWAPVVTLLGVNHVIDVVAADGSFDCELRVVKLGPSLGSPLWAQVRVLRAWHLDEASEMPTDTGDVTAEDFKITFSPTATELHRISSTVTGDIIAKGIRTKVEALEIVERLRTERRQAA